MIRLAALFPEHLNLNGDQGNLEVIRKQLAWRGIASEVVSVSSILDLDESFALIFIGHGSVAAWQDLEDRFAGLSARVRELAESGTRVLAVSTGFEAAIKHKICVDVVANRMPNRVSKFEVIEESGSEVLGYVNTDKDLPALHRCGTFIGTTLHGPVLVKNPELLEEILRGLADFAGLSLSEIQNKEKASLLADLVSEVWSLERELASE
jgi:lipid II isoglutaminyl synthase (glutamine-hydrolysing)